MLPTLQNWDATRIGLHQASQVIGAIRRSMVERDEDLMLHHSVQLSPYGLTTGPLPNIGELVLFFEEAEVRLLTEQGGHVLPVSIQGKTQAELLERLLAALDRVGHPIKNVGWEPQAPPTVIQIDSGQAAAYRETLQRMAEAFTAFRETFTAGQLSPLVVWPHGFDMAFMWYRDGEHMNEHNPHAAYGYSPGSTGLPEPYIYAYIYPMPDDLPTKINAPGMAEWNTEHGWRGLIIDPSEVNAQDDLVRNLQEIHAALAPHLA